LCASYDGVLGLRNTFEGIVGLRVEVLSPSSKGFFCVRLVRKGVDELSFSWSGTVHRRGYAVSGFVWDGFCEGADGFFEIQVWCFLEVGPY